METHRTQLDKETGELKAALIHMATVAERMIEQVINELTERDGGPATEIRDEEDELNRQQIDIDEHVVTLLATRQPVAADLRFILAATKINNELERIGDLVINITQSVQVLMRESSLKPLIDIPRMSELAQTMVRRSIEAFVAHDTQLAQEVILADDELDALRDQVLRELLTYMIADPKAIERGIALFLVARHLERIGDHATNIAQTVIYMVQGRDVRHPRLPR